MELRNDERLPKRQPFLRSCPDLPAVRQAIDQPRLLAAELVDAIPLHLLDAVRVGRAGDLAGADRAW